MAINIIIAGVLGRMGRQIAAAVMAGSDVALAGSTEISTHELIGQKLGPCIG